MMADKRDTYSEINILYEYTALNGKPVKGSKVSDWELSRALEIFACLDVDELPPPDLSKPYTLTITAVPS